MCELQDLESTIPSTMDDNENENDAEATAATTTTNAFDPALSQANLSAIPNDATLVTLPNGTWN